LCVQSKLRWPLATPGGIVSKKKATITATGTIRSR